MKKLFLIYLLMALTACASVQKQDTLPTEGRLVLGEVDGITVISKRTGKQTIIDDNYNETTRELWEVSVANHNDKLTCISLAWNLTGYSWHPKADKLVLMPHTVKTAGYLKQTASSFGDIVLIMPGQAQVKSVMVKECASD